MSDPLDPLINRNIIDATSRASAASGRAITAQAAADAAQIAADAAQADATQAIADALTAQGDADTGIADAATAQALADANALAIAGIDHSSYDTHLADGTKHFLEGAIDHTAITNIGTNSHATLDSHLINAAVHYAEGDIDHGSIGGLLDDDHTQYVKKAGDTMTGSLGVGGAPSDIFHVVATGNANAFVVEDSTGKLGFGTATPGQYFDVSHSVSGGTLGARVDNTSTSASSNSRFICKTAAGGGDPYFYAVQAGGQKWSAGLQTSSGEYRIANAQGFASGLGLAIDTSEDVYIPQSLAIGQAGVAASGAALEVDSTTAGILFPRMSTTERNLLPTTAGLVIYNNTTNKLNVYTGSAWEAVTSA